MPIQITRAATILKPDESRVLLRRFDPGTSERVAAIVSRILAIPEDGLATLIEDVCAEFSQRHKGI